MLPEHIVIGPDPGKLLKDFLTREKYTKIGVLLDEHTLQSCYPLIEQALPPHHTIMITAGEEQKNLETCTLVWQELTSYSFDRHSLLIIIGGGVLGDLGGFCAATYKRGIDFVLIPTTLLAQVDASIGGKLGIDFQHYKNHIGIFKEPTATLISSQFLKTLPARELRSGFAEVIKHCIISDRVMWQKISSGALLDQAWQELIPHSVAFKASVVKQDPVEKGLRKILNFGHTTGHAVESYLLGTSSRIFHGEAIAVGMITESFIAFRKGMLQKHELEEIIGFLIRIFGKTDLPETKEILPIMLQDKKNKGNKILLALPEGIGKAMWDVEATEKEIEESFVYYNALTVRS